MADDFNDWIDGEPITGPASDGSFTEWIDGEPVVRYEAEAPTTLVIPDAYHLHDADALEVVHGRTVYDVSSSYGGLSPTVRAYRNLADDTYISAATGIASPGLVRVFFAGPSSGDYGISGASIGTRSGTTEDYTAGQFVRLTFDGSNSTTVGADGLWSDWVSWDYFSPSSDTLVHFDTETAGATFNVPYYNNYYTYRKDGTLNDAMVADISGYGGISYSYGAVIIQIGDVNTAATDLVIPDATHLHDADNVALTQAHDLVVAEAYNELVDEGPLALTQIHDLVVAEAYDELVDEGPVTLQTGLTLVMAEAYHDLVDEGPLTLTQEHALVVAECDHLHDVDSIVLTALHILTVAECYHVHAPPNLTLTTLTALTVQESDHLHDSDNITLTGGITLSDLDSDHLHEADNIVLGYTETLQDLDAYHLHDADAAILECGQILWLYNNTDPSDDTDYAYGDRNYRQYWSAAKAFPNHGFIRFMIKSQPSYAVDLDHMSVGVRSGTTDDYASAPTEVTFNSGALDVSLTANDWIWSDWISYTAADGEYLLTNIWDEGGHMSVWVDGQPIYQDNGPIDRTLTQVVSFSGTPNSRFIAGIQVKPATLTALTIGDSHHLHVADSIATFNTEIPSIDNTYHLHDADDVELTQEHTLSIDEADHLHDADGIVVFSRIDLVVAESGHLHDADPVALTQEHSLIVNPGDHLHDAETLTLTQDHTLALADDTLLHVADTLNLAGISNLVVAEAYHVHAADSADLIVVLAVDEAHHLHTAPNLTIVSGFDLVIPETVILTVSDNIAGMTVSMTVASSYHDHLADALAITANHYLTVAETDHLHIADSLNTYMTGDLPIQSAHHEIESDELTLGFSLTLTVREAYHRHFVDTLALTQEHTLAMPDGDSYHDHFADNIEILALPEGLERTFIDSLTADRTFWTRTTDLEILTPTRPIDDTVLTSYLGVTTKHELASLTQARTILRI